MIALPALKHLIELSREGKHLAAADQQYLAECAAALVQRSEVGGQRSEPVENRFAVGKAVAGEGKVVINSRVPIIVSREDPLNLAVWLAAVADPDCRYSGSDFQRQLRGCFL